MAGIVAIAVGITAGLGLLACACATFLLMPAALLAFDRGTGPFAPAVTAVGPDPAPARPWLAFFSGRHG